MGVCCVCVRLCVPVFVHDNVGQCSGGQCSVVLLYVRGACDVCSGAWHTGNGDLHAREGGNAYGDTRGAYAGREGAVATSHGVWAVFTLLLRVSVRGA